MEAISRASVGETPLDSYVDVVARIYRAHDKNRSIWDVWCHTLHHAAGVVEQIRAASDNGALQRELADFSLWLFTAILKFRGSLGQPDGGPQAPHDCLIRITNSTSDFLWRRYPNCCPRCWTPDDDRDARRPTQCVCRRNAPETDDQAIKRKRTESVALYADQIQNNKPYSINAWQDMFFALFQDHDGDISLSEAALRLMEELGKTSDGMIRTYTYKTRDFIAGEPNWRQLNLESNLAEVFRWLFTLSEKMIENREGGHPIMEKKPDPERGIGLSKIIWDRYGCDDRGTFCCWKCKACVCECQIILVPGTHSVESLVELIRRE